jgi:uncharacterized pyridoxal phosphate-containing UPF0001 family protein
MKKIHAIFDFVHSFGAQVVAVTKYHDAAQTHLLYEAVKGHPAFCALGENRLEVMESKNIPPQHMHFIGHIQSRALKKIPAFCSSIHSLCTLAHAQQLADVSTRVFLQVNVSEESQKDGIMPDAFADFLASVQALQPFYEIVGIAGMGRLDCDEATKRAEFKTLIRLRDAYLPNGLISAGTSADYEIALEEGVDIVRLGRILDLNTLSDSS